jgi:hypothetical protein
MRQRAPSNDLEALRSRQRELSTRIAELEATSGSTGPTDLA